MPSVVLAFSTTGAAAPQPAISAQIVIAVRVPPRCWPSVIPMLKIDGIDVVSGSQLGIAPQASGAYPMPPTTGRPAAVIALATTDSVPASKSAGATMLSSPVTLRTSAVAVAGSPFVSATTTSTGRPATPPVALTALAHACATGTEFSSPDGSLPVWLAMIATRRGLPPGRLAAESEAAPVADEPPSLLEPHAPSAPASSAAAMAIDA